MSELRVMHLISGGDTGGARTHVLQLINGLGDRIEVHLVTLMESDFTEDAQALNLPLKVLRQRSRLDLSVTRELKRMIREQRIQLVHVHGARANFIISFVKKAFPELPVVTTIHSDYLLDDYRGGKLLTRLFRKMNERALKKIDYYIGVSDEFRKMMIDRGFSDSQHAFAVYNGIDFSREIVIVTDREAFRKNCGVEDPETVLVGIMGRLDPVKDHFTFLKAAKWVLEQDGTYRFCIAGDGRLRETLERFTEELGISEQVTFLGRVDRPFDFFNAIDLNVLTSLSESFPYVMLEGARMGLPLVTTDVGGVDRLIRNGVTGQVVPVGDAEAVGQAILKVTADRRQLEEMGKALGELVEAQFSHRRFIERHLEIYQTILEEKA